jgi:hypothetical protein
MSTLYLDHESWHAAAEALDPKNKGASPAAFESYN